MNLIKVSYIPLTVSWIILLKAHLHQAGASINSCLQQSVHPVPWLSAFQAGCADKGRPLGLSVMGLFSGRRWFSWFTDTGWCVWGLEGRAFGGVLLCVRAGVYVCAFGGELPGVSLARWQGEERRGERLWRQKQRNTGRDSSTRPNPHIDALTRTRPVEGRWPQQHSWEQIPLRDVLSPTGKYEKHFRSS